MYNAKVSHFNNYLIKDSKLELLFLCDNTPYDEKLAKNKFRSKVVYLFQLFMDTYLNN